MSLKRLSSWQSIAVIVPGALIVVFSAIAVVHLKPDSGSSTARPQSGMVVSYGIGPSGFGDSCGGVAVVRLKDGEVVRAASFQHAYLQDGAVVTVVRHRSTCPPALYMVVHGGPPGSSSSRTPTPLHGARAG